MSTNLFLRLRSILPSSPTLIAEVLAHNADGTSALRLPTGLGQDVYATGVSVGSQFTARGTSVPVGAYAYVRDGVVQAQAPTGVVADAVVGAVAAQPFGPTRLAAAGAVTLAGGSVGVVYANSLTTAVLGGYPRFTFTLASGALPPGLALSAAGLTGTPAAAGAYSFVLTVMDSTRRSVTTGALGVTVV